MIPKITSHEFNNILDDANKKIEDINISIDNIKTSMYSKLKIVRYECEYIEQQMQYLESSNQSLKNSLDLFNKSYDNNCSFYGLTATPKFKSNYFNILNLITKADGKAYFRDIVNVTINGVEEENFKDIFKHETIENKNIYFNEFNTDTVTLSVEVDPTKVIVNSLFNVIELDSFFNGSYDIESIKVYADKDGTKYEEYNGYKNAGKMRIVLDKLHSFYKIDLTFKLSYYNLIDDNKIYPFGLKHIYLINTSFLDNSYGIIEINSDDYINYINDAIKVRTPNEIIETSITNENIEIYLNCIIKEDGTYEFSSKQTINKNDNNLLSVNTKKIYAKVPLQGKAIIGIQFNIE